MNKNVVISGIRWTFITSVLRRVLTLILFFFIAKWLTKEDLGLFREYSIILAFVSAISLLSLDFHYIVEQQRKITGLIALWQITLIAAILGFIILSLGAGLIGNIYHSNTLVKLFRYTAVFVIVETLRSGVRAIATKQLRFKALAIAETLNVVFYSVVSMAVLYFYRSLWVFLIVFYLGNLIELVYLWHMNRKVIAGISRKMFDQSKSRLLCLTLTAHRSFLAQATLVSVFNQVSSNAPILILGMMVNPVLIGLYFFASQLIGVPVGMFTNAIHQVFFPVFAGKQDSDISNMSSRFIRLVGYVGMPLLLAFSFVIMYAVGWLFNGKWDDAIPLIMPVFLIFGTSLYCTPLGGIPFVKRKPGWELVWNMCSLGIKVAAMLVGLRVSFEMAVWLFAIASVVTNIAFYLMSMVLVQQKPAKTMLQVLYSLIPSGCLAILIIFAERLQSWMAVTIVVLGSGVLLLIVNYVSKGLLAPDIKMLLHFERDGI